MPSLNTLDLSNNKLDDLGEGSIFQATWLEYLSIENNNLRVIPPELSLLRLNVLLVGGNPQRLVSAQMIQQVGEIIKLYTKYIECINKQINK